jgi:hypothetical protein
MHTLLRAGTALAALSSIAVAIACSSSTPTPDGGVPPQVCPSTLAHATTPAMGDAGEGYTNACHVVGYQCAVSFPCADTFVQQANCTCTLNMDMSTTFNCVLQTDNSIVPPNTVDAGTLCQSVETVGDAHVNPCPDKTMASTSAIACTNSGQTCFYTGVKCSGDQVSRTDTCQCVDNASGDAGLSWACDINSCN